MSYGVVGGGLMGSGIAFLISSKREEEVIIYDISDEALHAAKSRLESFAEKAVKRGTSKEDAQKWVDKIQLSKDLSSLSGCEIVVEAVFENLEVKQKIFKDLEQVVSDTAILASNTSGISISDIATVTKHPERVIGTHFFNPAPVMKLVEIVTGVHTSEDTLNKAKEFCVQLEKEIIVAKDYPGFVVTRVGQAMICEAIRCLEEGVASPEDIDKGMRLGYNYPLGPLELVDLIGLDTELKIQQSLFEELGEVFRPSSLLKRMVAGGMLGRKSGKGFYTYN